MGFPGGCSVVKNPPAKAGDAGSIPGLGRSPGEGNDNLLQHSYLENSTHREARWATVHGVTKSWTQLYDWRTRIMFLFIVVFFNQFIPHAFFCYSFSYHRVWFFIFNLLYMHSILYNIFNISCLFILFLPKCTVWDYIKIKTANLISKKTHFI